MAFSGSNANDRMVIAEQVLSGVYGPEMQSQFTSSMLAGNYGDDLKNIAEQFNSVAASLDDSAPTVMGEGPSLQEINPDSTTFVAPETVSDPRERGALAFNRYSTGGLGAIPSVPNIPQMALDTPLSLNQIIDSGVGIRGTDTKASQELAEFLASRRSDVPGANLPGESNPYVIDPNAAFKAGESLSDDVAMAELMAQAKIEREGFGAGVEDQLSLQEQLANKLDFAVDANKSARLSEINTPPPSVIAAQANAAARAEDAPTFMGDVVPFLGDASVAAGKSLYNSLFPQKTVGPDDVIAELREQNLSVEDKAAQLGLTSITGKDGEPYFISPAGMVFAQEGEDLTPVSGGAAMNIMDVAQNQGKDFSKSPLGEIPFGSYATDEAGNVLPDSYTPMAPIDISGIKSPDFLEGALGPESTIGSVLNVQEGAAPTTSVSEEGVRVFPASPDPSLLSDATTIAEQAAEAAAETTTEDQMLEASGAADATYPATVTTDDDPNKRLPTTDPDPAGFGSTDSRIAKMLSERQKQAESDKWMALAQAGFELMKPTPTIGEGFGKAGQAGLAYLTKSKQGLRDFETDMLKLETQLAAARLRSQGTGKTSATAYAALERAHSNALTLAIENPTAPNLARFEELDSMLKAARAEQFGTVTAGNTNSGVIKTPSAQAG
jgi:hypothetical protein